MADKRDVDCVVLDGNSLTTKTLVTLGREKATIKLSPESIQKVVDARKQVEDFVKEKKVVYAVTTGFGNFARKVISHDKLSELQCNLIRSHAAGVGNALSPERTKRLLALRINVLAKGYSGISLKVLEQYIAAFNASCLPYVPEKGTVGASGDLAPLSHIAFGLMGEGRMWSPETGWKEAKEVLRHHNLTPIELGPKEGIALINGTQLIAALGAEAVERARLIALQADVIAALTLECLGGTNQAFDRDVHRVRPHVGQMAVAARFRALIHNDLYPSEVAHPSQYHHVQDAYSLRCCPQVHGIVWDTIDFVHRILSTEINSATDNPLVFASRGEVIAAGNFHGEYPAKALDYLAIGVHELSSISERRIERLNNPGLNFCLPAFLIKEGGLNSGFMMAHCTAAALVSENKVLCHPSSIDSISTSAATEDHVSMGGWSARKALQVVEHVEQVLAIELLAACQALEFSRPKKTTEPLEALHAAVRQIAKPWETDHYVAAEIEVATQFLQEGKAWKAVEPFIEKYRATCEPE